MDDPADQFLWLENILRNAKGAGERVLIEGHVPPGMVSTMDLPWFYEKYNTKMNEILVAYGDIIMGTYFGHEHSDNFRVYHNDTGNGVLAQFCAASVTPWRYKLPGKTGPAHNPSLRLFKYERSTKQLLDFTQYYMDLPEVNKNNRSEWKIEYEATSVYGLSDLSPSSMSELVRKMKKASGTEFSSFHRFWTVSVAQEYQESCDKSCHARFYCSFRYYSIKQYKTCLESILPVSSVTQANCSYIVILFISVFIYVI